MPLVFAAGMVACIYSLIKSANRKTAAIGIALNLFFLFGLLYLFTAHGFVVKKQHDLEYPVTGKHIVMVRSGEHQEK